MPLSVPYELDAKHLLDPEFRKAYIDEHIRLAKIDVLEEVLKDIESDRFAPATLVVKSHLLKLRE